MKIDIIIIMMLRVVRRFVSRPQVVTLNRFLAALGIDRRLPNRGSEIEHNLFGGWRAAGEGDESISSYLAPYVEFRLVDLTYFFPHDVL